MSLQIGRRTVTLDTGLRPARLARSEITADCIIGSMRQDTTPRRPGECTANRLRVAGMAGSAVQQLGGGGAAAQGSGLWGMLDARVLWRAAALVPHHVSDASP